GGGRTRTTGRRCHAQTGGRGSADGLAAGGNRPGIAGGCGYLILMQAERGRYSTGGCHRPGGKGVAAQGAVTAGDLINGIASIRYHTQRGGAAISDALAGRGNRATITGGCGYLILIQAERGRY